MCARWVALAALIASALSCASARPRRARRAFPPLDAARPVAPERAAPAPVPVDACSETGEDMDAWVGAFGLHAIEQGVSPATVEGALSLAWYDGEIIELDRAQRATPIPFDEFLASHVTTKRVARARGKSASLGPALAKLEAEHGVQDEVLLAIWGLETDFGDNVGAHPAIRALATLAYDCRRAAFFRGELLAALRVVDRGDLAPGAMIGGWAGEVGQTQFMPSSYEKFAVDADGDGHADLIGSSLDALGSTARYLEAHGWAKGGAYREGSENFGVLGKWNASLTWDRTIAAFAAKIGPG